MKPVIRLANPEQARPDNPFFAEGEAARAEGRHIDSNPHPAYSEPYWEWQNGWFAVAASRPRSWRQHLRTLVGWLKSPRSSPKLGDRGEARTHPGF
jgi:hypothetical protein